MPTTRLEPEADSVTDDEAECLAGRLRALECQNRTLVARTDALETELALLKSLSRGEPQGSQAAYFAVADESPVMLWVFDEEDRPAFYNRAALDFLGLDLEAALASDIHELIHPDDRRRIELADQEVQRSAQAFQNEYRMRRADGEYRWVLDVGMPRFAADGAYMGSSGCCIDVTERRLALDALRDSEAALARAQRTAKIGSWRWSLGDHPTASGSEEFAGLLGLEHGKTFTCRDLYRAVHGEDRRRVEEIHARAARTGSDYRIDYRIPCPDGSIRHVQEIGEARRDPTGRLIEHRGTLQDVTERKEAEAALRQARDDAELANKAKSDFLANMSHELRTPLNAVLGFTEILQRELHGPLGDPAYNDYIEDIHQSGRHLLALINDILDLSKIETGNATLEESEFELDELLRACLRFVSERAAENGVTLSAELTESGLGLKADPRKLKQIVINMLSNAVKFTPAGGKVVLRCLASASDGCVIEISDTGIGMSKADIPRALDRFRQLDDGMTRRQEGTGLGLPLSKALTELHGGTLGLRSLRGHGTTVTIRLPAARIVKRLENAVAPAEKPSHLASVG